MALPTSDYYNLLCTHFEANGNPTDAKKMKQYMRNKFEFYGLKSPIRRTIQKAIFVDHGWPSVEQLPAFLQIMWQDPHRDFQLCAIDLLEKNIKKVDYDFIEVLEQLIITKSWWDTVDMLAAKLTGIHFKRFPELTAIYPDKWMASGNMWLQRSAIIYQLKYRKATDVERLFDYILQLKTSKEFFIQKAAGWALREYSKTDWELVHHFIEDNEDLAPLTKREGLKWMIKQGAISK